MTKDVLDAFWRAMAYCLHPRVIVWSLLPLVIAGVSVWMLGALFWEPAIDEIHAWLRGWSLLEALRHWLERMGWSHLYTMLPILVLMALAVPAVVLLTLLLVALLMVPAIVKLVAARRFPAMQRRRGAGLLASVGWSIGCTLLAAVALLASLPLWLLPPLALLLPPLIWGWLSCKVMSFDVLADHASADERRQLLRAHRTPLLVMGVATGYLGSAPTLLWGMGAMALPLAPLLMPAALWLYTLVFAFSALWYAHYALAALHRLRLAAGTVEVAADVLDLPADLPPLPAPAAEKP